MFIADWVKTVFMIEQANCQYNVMPFGLKNAGVTYQRKMNKIFWEKIMGNLEVCMDNMIVKSSVNILHAQRLKWLFRRVRQYTMRLDLEKCIFTVRVDKLLVFYFIERGIEVNLDKCEADIQMRAPTSKKGYSNTKWDDDCLEQVHLQIHLISSTFLQVAEETNIIQTEWWMQQHIRVPEEDLSNPIGTYQTVTMESFVYLPSSCWVGGECRPHNRNKFRTKSGIFCIKCPSLSRNLISKNWESCPSRGSASRTLVKYFLAHSMVVIADFP